MSKSRRIAVVGSRAVGKSSLCLQFAEGRFVDSYYPTIENTLTTTRTYGGHTYSLELLDTAGQDAFSIVPSNQMISIHGYILVYAITSKASFDLLSLIRDKILNGTGSDWVPIVIVGNKCDLEAQRQVSREEAEQLAKEWRCASVESSAKQNIRIEDSFEKLMQLIENKGDAKTGDAGANKKGCLIS